MINKSAIENAVTSALGVLSYRDNKEFSAAQAKELAKAIAAAIEVYDRQVREQEPPKIVNP